MYYIYVYLDTRKKGSYSYGDFHFEYEPFYIGKGVNDRYLTHLRIAKGDKNNLVISKIKSILNDGFEPTIIKIINNLTIDNYNDYEISAINIIGKLCDNRGPLLNITNGGDGGITWIGEHHNKGKKLEDIVGYDKAIKLKEKLSKDASNRIGELNPNYGNVGELNPLFGKEMSEETKDRIRKKSLEQFSKYSNDEIKLIIKNMNDARQSKPDEVKQVWYDKMSKTLKEKYENGELFSEEHREKLKLNNFKSLNKGNDILKTSDEVKLKISNSLKGRIFSSEHREKLRKCINFDVFESIIVSLLSDLKTITAYRKYAKDNPELKLPQIPEKSYKNDGWEGWQKYKI